MLQALNVQLHLRVAPLGTHKVRHGNDGTAAVLAVGGDAQIGGYLADDIARHRGCKDGGIVCPCVVGVVQHDVDQNFRVVGGQHRHERSHLLIVAIGAAVHIQLLGSAGLAADAVTGHIGVFAAAGAVAHLVLHHLPDNLAGALADDLTAHICADLLNDIAVGIGDLIHHMGGDQIPAVDGGRNGGAHLQRGDGHGLTEGGGGQLHLAQLVGAVVLHKVGLAGQVHAGAGGKAEGIEVVIELLRADALPQLDVVDVAAFAQCLGHIEQAVRLAPCAVVSLLGHTVGTGTGKGGVHGRHTGVDAHGGGNDLEHRARVVQLRDGLVLPQDIPVVTGIVRFLVQDFIALFIGDVVAIGILFIDAVKFRLCVHQLVEVSLVGSEVQRVVGVKVRLGSHGKDGTGLDVHHNGAATVFYRIGCNGFVQVPLRDLLHVHIQRQHQIGAVLGGKGGGVGVCNGVAHRVALGDGAAIHTGQGGLVGFFQSVGADAVCIRKAQHRCGKGTVGVVALEAFFRGHRDAPLAGGIGGLFVRLVEAGDVFFNGKLHRVVHLGGKGDVGRIQPG